MIAELNGQEVKLVKFRAVFPWHIHVHEDEMFLVWSGSICVEFRDKIVRVKEGELFVFPKGVEHRTSTDAEAHVLIFEPALVRGTGNVVDNRFTSPIGAKI